MHMYIINSKTHIFVTGCSPEIGVPDMTVISDIDETGINRNLQIRYIRDEIYVSFFSVYTAHELTKKKYQSFIHAPVSGHPLLFQDDDVKNTRL